MKDQLDYEFKKLHIDVLVHVLYHPTEFVSQVFTLDNFERNENKKVIQIGAWLRRPYSIYNMQLPETCRIKKAVLKGKHMESNFPPSEFEEKCEDIVYVCDPIYLNMPCMPCMPCMSRCPRNTNKYIQGMVDALLYNNNSVEILEFAENGFYDELLSNNIVFLDRSLVDAMGVNAMGANAMGTVGDSTKK